VEIDYFSPTSDKESKRTVTPFHFFEENGVEYLQAHCHQAQGTRTFRVDRINCSRPVDGAPTVEGASSNSLKKIRALALVHSLDRATSEALELSSEALTPGSPVEIEAFATDWLMRTVLASDSGLEIIEPVSLRDLITKRVDAAIALYE
jgi:proteasome accessory factor C